ncbi:MAG: hypothetical protein NTY15_20135 [Planctomycetota bacterium]|jgi:hypothetical protein|nr:hypothetical protein [Planctomycetota bacterium]
MLSMSFVFCLIVSASISHRGNQSVDEYVDLIELNHFFDQQGRLVYDQVVFYERAPETGKFQVRAWCLVEDREYLNRRPVKNLETELYQVDWFDTDQRLLRKITSRLYRESWTQVDPERSNKKFHDERLRISLIQNPKKFQQSQTQEPDEPKHTVPTPAIAITAAEQRAVPVVTPVSTTPAVASGLQR